MWLFRATFQRRRFRERIISAGSPNIQNYSPNNSNIFIYTHRANCWQPPRIYPPRSQNCNLPVLPGNDGEERGMLKLWIWVRDLRKKLERSLKLATQSSDAGNCRARFTISGQRNSSKFGEDDDSVQNCFLFAKRMTILRIIILWGVTVLSQNLLKLQNSLKLTMWHVQGSSDALYHRVQHCKDKESSHSFASNYFGIFKTDIELPTITRWFNGSWWSPANLGSLSSKLIT